MFKFINIMGIHVLIFYNFLFKLTKIDIKIDNSVKNKMVIFYIIVIIIICIIIVIIAITKKKKSDIFI